MVRVEAVFEKGNTGISLSSLMWFEKVCPPSSSSTFFIFCFLTEFFAVGKLLAVGDMLVTGRTGALSPSRS